MPDTSTLDGWNHEFSYWKHIAGFEPVKLIASVDESPDWEMDRRHVLLMKNGSYATVIENGCSCYDSSEAVIDFHKTLSEALESASIKPDQILPNAK